MSDAKILEGKRTLRAALARTGVPPQSDWWRAGDEAFYLHPTARERYERVGRGGAKSDDLVDTAIAETIYGTYVIPPGERHYYAHVSENVTEAQKTLRIMAERLSALRVPFERAGDAIELAGMQRGIRVLACRVGAVSGFRCFGWNADEAPKWSVDGTNPSDEIISSMRAMTVTHPTARGHVYGSPMAKVGFFYDACIAGTTDRQVARHAPTWLANSSVTEAQTRALEPHAAKWLREYAAEFADACNAAFPSDVVLRAFRQVDTSETIAGAPHVIIDAASGGEDRFTYGLARWIHPRHWQVERVRLGANAYENRIARLPDGSPMPAPEGPVKKSTLLFEHVDVIPAGWKADGGAIVDRIVAFTKRHGAARVIGDQREALMLGAAFKRQGVAYDSVTWGNENKVAAVEEIRRHLRDGSLILPKHDGLQSELLAFEEKITPSGTITFAGRGRTHDDFVALIVTACIASRAGLIAGTPGQRTSRRIIPSNVYG